MAKVTLTSKSSAMKSALPILSLALIFASCTTAYKSGQTPDDVYFSPARPQDEYVRQEKKDDHQYRYYNEEAYRDDRYLRMKIRDQRYSGLYDDYYSYNPYYYHYYNNSLYYNSPWNSYSSWNYYYNPYCVRGNTGYSSYSKATVYNKPRTFDLGIYNPDPQSSNTNSKGIRVFGNPSSPSSGTYRNNNNYRNSGTNAGGFLRDILGGSGSSSNSGGSSSKSTGSSGSSSGSSGGSSGSSNAPTRKF